MQKLSGYSKTEKTIIMVLVPLIIVMVYFLLEDPPKDALTEAASKKLPHIGEITRRENDIRFKPKDTFAWESAAPTQLIHIGDSVFAGKKSFAQVNLNKGGMVVVGENSLVTFNQMENEKMMNLVQGNFRISVVGKAKVAIRGRVTQLEGKNSEIQIFTDKSLKPRIKVLSGKTQMHFENTESFKNPPLTLSENDIMEIPEAKPEEVKQLEPLNLPEDIQAQLAAPEPPPPVPTPVEVAVPRETPVPIEELPVVVAAKPVEPIQKKVRQKVAVQKRPVRKIQKKLASEEKAKPLEPAPLAAEKIQVPPPPPATFKDSWVWLGVGVGYTSYAQKINGFSNFEFRQLKGPSSLLRGGFYLTDSFGLDLGYKTTPGEARSSSAMTVAGGSYTWTSFSAEALYRREKARVPALKEWNWRLGVQQHQVPFLIPTGPTSLNLEQSLVNNLTLGFEYKKKLRDYLRFEWLMRYQRPMSSSSKSATQFEVTPTMSFDGSLGLAREFRKDFFVGLYWYGQYHNFEYLYRNNLGANFQGTESLFFTNFDLRLGAEF